MALYVKKSGVRMKSEMMSRKVFLSTLWIFLVVNYIFCDVFTLFYAPELNKLLSGVVGGVELTQEFLLVFAVTMEISMLMIVLSRVLNGQLNRWANIITGALFTLIQTATLFDGETTLHYMFFSSIEISTTLFIIWTAWNWSVNDQDHA